jgi:N4-(beta-N-acetylglucosaminyl)-L-asparaginase
VAEHFPVIAIASHNGLEATRLAHERMRDGADPLDAAVAGVTLVEDDPEETSVGYGGLPNEDGIVELDAAVMHGPTHRAGGIAGLRNVRHAAQVARLVMQYTDHALLVGEGALRFAKAHGFREEDLLTEKSRKIWLYWKQTLSPRDDWLPPPSGSIDPDVAKFFKLDRPAAPASAAAGTSPKPPERIQRPAGTVHLAAMNAAGDLSCVTSTSGLAFKIAGRVGDSPLVGAGLYVDNDIGSCGSTGRGEATMQNVSSFAAVERMRGGMSPADAGREALRRVVQTSEPRLLKDDGTPDFDLKLYLLAKDGRYAAVSLWGPAQFAVTDERGTRKEECVFLYEKQGT